MIGRLRNTATNRRILKASKGLKDGEYPHVNINEDLTKTRNSIAYRARPLHFSNMDNRRENLRQG